MTYYLLVFAAVVLLAVNFSLNKIYQTKAGTGLYYSVFFNTVCGLFTAILFFILTGVLHGFDSFTVTAFSLTASFFMAALCGSYALLGFKIISMGDIAVYTLFLMLGGMTLPYFYGLLALGEAKTQTSLLFGDAAMIFRVVGLLLMAAAILLSGLGEKTGERKKASKFFFPLCAVVFCLNGCVSILSKLHQLPENAARAVNAEEFVMLTALWKTVIFGIILLFLYLKKKKTADNGAEKKLPLGAMLVILASAAADGLSYLLQLLGAVHLPATVLYPLVTGGSVILTALCGRFFFGEKLSRRAFCGILLCFISTFFFL